MSTELHVLIIDDSGKDALLIERALKKKWPGLVVGRIETGSALREALQQQTWDCVLCDMVIPGFGAPMALASVRKTRPDLPFIIVSGVVDIDDVISMLKGGAHDFVRKDHLARLIPAIEKALEDAENLRQRYQTEIKLKESEEQYRTLIEQSPLSIQVHHPDGRLQHVNAASKELWGLDGHQLETLLSHYNILEDAEIIKSGMMPLIEKVFAGEYAVFPPFEYDTSLILKRFSNSQPKAKKCWINSRGYPVKTADGSILSIIFVLEDITESRRAEQRAALFSRVLERTLNEIYIFDSDTLRFLDVNLGARKNLGYTLQELQSLTPLDIKPEHTAESFAGLIEPLRTGAKEKLLFTTVHRRKDGTLYPVEVYLQLMDEDQSVFVAMISDITKRKQAEARLSLSEQRLRLHRNQTSLGVIEWDMDFQVIGWNAAAEEIFGYSQDEVKVRDFVNILLPESTMDNVKQLWKVIKAQTGGTKSINENITKDGSIIQCEWHNTLLKDRSGTVIGATSLVLDITAQHKAIQALSVKEQEQREILNSMVDAIITIDETGSIISFNKAAEVLFGYSVEEVVGQNINRLMPEPDSSQHDGYLQHYLQTGDARVIGVGRDVEGQHKNKQTFPMRLSVAELPADESGKRRFIGTCHDLTQYKKQQEQLRHNQKMDALSKLTGGMAHDFNNMLSVVSGYAALLEEELAERPELANYAHEIHHAGERGAKLTRKLLSFSRKEAPDAAKLDINSLLQQQQDVLQTILTVRVQLLFSLADDVWPIWLDSGDLEDAILNMSINAMHAMKDKAAGARLTIRTDNQSLNTLDALTLGLEAGDYVLLCLTDTGTGMDEATREKIFDPFFSTKGEQGTGLGLSQVFGFVKRSSGAIKVYSEPGHGSKFALYFPRYLGDDFDEATETGGDNVDLRGTETILIVDDETALRDLASRQLSKQGYRILCAENGKQALQILAHEHIDVMLTDIIMPDMDGYQLAAVVQEKYPAIKIQLASGFADTLNMDLMNESLHQNLLHKPYNSQALFKRIRALLDN